MNYYGINTSKQELHHYGILGMKWGVRRYQNPDGSLTPAGEKRYGFQTGKKYDYKLKGNSHLKNTAKMVGRIGTSLAIGTAIASTGPAALAFVNAARTVDYARSSAKLASELGGNIFGGAIPNKAMYKLDGGPEKLSKLKRLNKKESHSELVKSINPKDKLGLGRHFNCSNCAIAADMRRRGYDVQARRATQGRTNDEIANFYKGGEFKKLDISRGFETKRHERQRAYDSLCKTLAKDGDGARGFITFSYSTFPAAHAVFYEVRNGRTYILEGQTGNVFGNESMQFFNPKSIEYMRTDNLQPSDSITTTVVSKKG